MLKQFRSSLLENTIGTQDIEFTIEKGNLHAADHRQKDASAAVKIAVDMVEEGLIMKEEAIMRVDPPRWTNCCTGE